MTVTESFPATDLRRIGQILDWPGAGPGGTSVPYLCLICDGSDYNRTTYRQLYAKLVSFLGTVTFTNASPAVFTTGSAHGLVVGDAVFFIGGVSAAPPTPDTQYYVMTVPSPTTFTLGDTRTYVPSTNTLTVTGVVNAAGAQTGTSYLHHDPWLIGSTTTFKVPDLRNGRQLASMGYYTQNILGLAIGEDANNGSLNVAAGGDYAVAEQSLVAYATKVIYAGVSP